MQNKRKHNDITIAILIVVLSIRCQQKRLLRKTNNFKLLKYNLTNISKSNNYL